MAKKKIEPNGTMLKASCSFGGVSVGDKTARIGVSIEREHLTLKTADDILCDRRIQGKIISLPAGSQSDQGALPGMDEEIELDGIFDVKGLSHNSKHISFGLTFMLKGLDVGGLALFAKRNGRIEITGSEEIGDEE